MFVLADGLGGYANGEVASRLVCDELPRLYYQSTVESSRENLHEAISQANEIVYDAAETEVLFHQVQEWQRPVVTKFLDKNRAVVEE